MKTKSVSFGQKCLNFFCVEEQINNKKKIFMKEVFVGTAVIWFVAVVGVLACYSFSR